jgi:shikimate dehydrogenase
MVGIRGLNVTIPYKSDVIPVLNRIDDLAKMVGAVNVIDIGDEMTGYNTDVSGAVRALREEGVEDLSGLKALIFGAGGSARALAFGLVQEGCDLTIANRTPSRSDDLAREVAQKTGAKNVTTIPLEKPRMEEAISESDILINATPVGMYPEAGHSIVAPRMLRPELVVMDLVYNPPRTRLLIDAENTGCTTVGGLSMLVYQAAESIEIWTSRKAPISTMVAEAGRALGTYPSE